MKTKYCELEKGERFVELETVPSSALNDYKMKRNSLELQLLPFHDQAVELSVPHEDLAYETEKDETENRIEDIHGSYLIDWLHRQAKT